MNNKERHLTEEHKQAISASIKRFWKNRTEQERQLTSEKHRKKMEHLWTLYKSIDHNNKIT